MGSSSGTPLQKLLIAVATYALLHVSQAVYVKTNHARHAQQWKLEQSVDTLSWDMDRLRQLDNLANKNFNDKKEYEESFDMMHYLGLDTISGLHMAVPLNLVFIGFSGNGNFKVNLTYDELTKWFEHVDHVLPHSRIALSELNCGEDGQCSKFNAGPRPQPLMSYVHLNFSCQIIQLNDRAVLDVFDQAIFAFSRPVDPEHEEGPQQVDMERMELFIDHFTTSLGLQHHPAIIILNPIWSATRPQYGYRVGFSSQEIQFLSKKAENAKVFALSRQARHPEPDMSALSQNTWHWNMRHESNKFSKQDVAMSSNTFVEHAKAFLEQETQYRKHLLNEVGRGVGSSALAHALRIMSHPTRTHHSLLHTTLLNNPGSGIGNKFRTMLPIEDCLVGNWVSRKRWIMLDLTSWGYQWGPALGGEGAVHRSSVPNVQDFFQAVKDRKDAENLEKQQESDHKLRELLDNMRTNRVSTYANQHHHAYMQNQERLAGAPGSDNPEKRLQQQLDWEAKYREVLIQAELDVIEGFALRHCHNVKNPPIPCVEARDQATELKQRLQTLSSSSASVQSLVKDHNWDIFGSTTRDSHGPAVMTEDVRAHDLFQAELAAILSRAIRHVVTPPSATWKHQGYLHDTATPYATSVNFDIYVITDSSRRAHPNVVSEFPLEAFQAQVESLKLKSQQFRFEITQMSLADDPGLAVAFASSLKTTFQELPSSEMQELLKNEQVYVDSEVLAYELRKQRPRAQQRVTSSHAYLEVPVYIFLLEREYPVLIDEHYSAKALEDMVIVVQNAMSMLEHPTGMMCNGALISRPANAMKEALAAVLQHLGGVLPPHLGYNPLRHRITHDWLWSVGYHVLSATAHGVGYTDLQRDALYRSYLLDAMDTSVEMVNEGLAKLSHINTHVAYFENVKKHEATLTKILRTYQHIMRLWRKMAGSAFDLEFAEATVRIAELEGVGRVFKNLCKTIADDFAPLSCEVELGHHPYYWMPSKWVWLGLSLIIFLIVLISVGLWIRRRNNKPKLN